MGRDDGLDVRTKRVYEEPAPEDGFRVLVDRLWPRGVSRERAALDLWLRDLGPSHELRRWFGHDPDRWDGFRERYRVELDGKPDLVGRLRRRLAEGRVTLLYSARDERHNQAVALASYLREGPA
ncbi:MAG: DUF488 family protein [Gemmatimonadota bacterium]|nr:DUF488 family protein [Gemmatimonadota bacterium]